MRSAIIGLLAALLLSACSESAESGDERHNTAVSSVESEEPAEADYFEAQIISYENGVLTYETDRQHSAEMDPRSFENDSFTAGTKQLSQLIISRFQPNVTGRIRLDVNGTRVISCDVITPNGEYYNNSMLSDNYTGSIEDSEGTMKRINGCIYEISAGSNKITADLNDLESLYKYDFPDRLDRIVFEGYKAKKGGFIIQSLSVFSGIDEMGSYIYDPLTNDDKYSFFGKVKSLKDGLAEIILTDEKTICLLPDYYTDGDLSENMSVMVTLNAGPELYGSGEKYEDSFAVFHTDPERFNRSKRDISELAYARYKNEYSAELIYFSKK